MEMEQADLVVVAEQWAHLVLVWIGFGTVAGLAAKAIMPGRDPGGAVATLMMGIGGSVVGSGTLMLLWEGTRVTPVSPLGFVVATAGAFIILFFYKMLAGHFFTEGEETRAVRRRRRSFRRSAAFIDD